MWGQTRTLAVQLNEAFLILGQLGSAGNLINLSLQDSNLAVPPSLWAAVALNSEHEESL